LAARPVGAASTIVAPLARASSTTERTVKDLPQPGELGAGPAAQPAEGLVPVDGGEPGEAVGPGGVQAQEGVSQGPFGLIEGRQVDGGDLRCGLSRPGPGRRGHLFAHHPVGGGQLVQARGDQVGGHVEDLGGVGDQVGRGQVAVPVVGGLLFRYVSGFGLAI
jgi:hypothetical protein